MHKIVSQLNRVHWFAEVQEERLFNKLGLSFGFTGKGGENFQCHSVKQEHGIKIVEAGATTDLNSSTRPLADGIYTHEPGLIVGVKTADCLPILLVSENKKTVMAIHAGWRGLCAGIVGKAVQKMQSLNPSSAIFACIGPAIGPCHYEVGPELVEAICRRTLALHSEQVGFCLTPGHRDRWFLDLASAAIFALLNANLSPDSISVFRSCTYHHPQLWHSFRKDKEAAVRNWSWIQIP